MLIQADGASLDLRTLTLLRLSRKAKAGRPLILIPVLSQSVMTLPQPANQADHFQAGKPLCEWKAALFLPSGSRF